MPASTSETNPLSEQPASSSASTTKRERPRNASIPEIIRASTPLFLAAIGGAIAVAVVCSPNLSDVKMTAALGLAGTAIAGAAGLAQPGNNESDFSVQRKKETKSKSTPQPVNRVAEVIQPLLQVCNYFKIICPTRDKAIALVGQRSSKSTIPHLIILGATIHGNR